MAESKTPTTPVQSSQTPPQAMSGLSAPQETPDPDCPPSPSPPASDEVTHMEAMRIVREGVKQILNADPLLSDLPAEVTAEEVGLQIALEYGQALTVCVEKFNGEIMPIVVLQGARVQDLKQSIQRYVTLKESRKGTQTSISWKYTWRTYSLCFEGQHLDENKKLKEYGIRNRDTVTFVKRRRKLGDRY